MPVAWVQDWSAGGADTSNYDAITERMGVRDDPPEGLIFHAAGATEEGGFRVFDVWESREHLERFLNERLMPAVQAVAGPDAPRPTNQMYELHAILQP